MCVPPALQNWFSSVRDGLFCSAVSIPQCAANSNTKLSQVRLFIRKNTLFFRKKGTFLSQMYHTTQTVRKAPTTVFFPFFAQRVGAEETAHHSLNERFLRPNKARRRRHTLCMARNRNDVWVEETPHQSLNERFLRPDEARRRRHTFCMARNRNDVWAEETPFKRRSGQRAAYTPPWPPCALG